MIIVNFPIEEVETRYTGQWRKWFHKEISDRLGSDDRYYEIYPPQLKQPVIDKGRFLNPVETHFFKSQQVAQVCNMIGMEVPTDRRVIFLFQDGWFPIEQLAYIRDMLGCHDWKFVGIFHDGTYDKWDLTARNNMYIWGDHLERAWFEIYDMIIVGSHYHKNELVGRRGVRSEKVLVTAWPVQVPETMDEKQNIVVFPHRLSPEKQPELFNRLAESFEGCGYTFVKTQSVVRSKEEYYKLLKKAKIAVSLSLLEMFGIGIFEATLCGCVPLVPDRLSYKEIYRSAFRYKDFEDLCQKLGNQMHVLKDKNGASYPTPTWYIPNAIISQSSEFFHTLWGVINAL